MKVKKTTIQLDEGEELSNNLQSNAIEVATGEDGSVKVTRLNIVKKQNGTTHVTRYKVVDGAYAIDKESDLPADVGVLEAVTTVNVDSGEAEGNITP